MNSSLIPWQRLLRIARQAPVDLEDASAPFGFSSRLVALAWAPEVPVGALLDRLSWRALGVALALMVASVAANFNPALSAFDDDTAAFLPDPVEEIISLS